MRKSIHKLFWVWDFDKEEKWLNEMAAKGLCLISVGFCKYEFEDCRPGEYSVRTERLEHHPDHPESVRYMSFLEETGRSTSVRITSGSICGRSGPTANSSFSLTMLPTSCT